MTCSLYVDYIFLDVDERRRFAQSQHEYLIEQLQFTGSESVTYSSSANQSFKPRLNFNHPVKYLAWVFRGSKHGQYAAIHPGNPDLRPMDIANLNTMAEALAPMHKAKLQLNGHDRFSERPGSYFSMVQPMQKCKTRPQAGIYLYSFALKPHEHQPSGTCNFSRIDNATLQITMKKSSNNGNVAFIYSTAPAANITTEEDTLGVIDRNTELRIYAKNYNILRIMSGMGGLAYAN
jgi:hypothetical protein